MFSASPFNFFFISFLSICFVAVGLSFAYDSFAANEGLGLDWGLHCFAWFPSLSPGWAHDHIHTRKGIVALRR
jgi:hypothetical protein